MVPLDVLSLEHEHHDDGEYRERDDFLYHLELQQVERAAVALEADAVGRDREAVFKEGDPPGKQDDQDERPGRRYFHFLEFKVAIPRECHEDIGKNQHQDSPETVHIAINSYIPIIRLQIYGIRFNKCFCYL